MLNIYCNSLLKYVFYPEYFKTPSQKIKSRSPFPVAHYVLGVVVSLDKGVCASQIYNNKFLIHVLLHLGYKITLTAESILLANYVKNVRLFCLRRKHEKSIIHHVCFPPLLFPLSSAKM